MKRDKYGLIFPTLPPSKMPKEPTLLKTIITGYNTYKKTEAFSDETIDKILGNACSENQSEWKFNLNDLNPKQIDVLQKSGFKVEYIVSR